MNRFDSRIYLFAMGHFAVDWAQGAIPALLPYFISACHLSYQDAATLMFANILLSTICQPIFGYYADRVAKPWFAPLGVIISGCSIALLPFVSNYWVIFLCSMFSGFGSAMYHPEAARMVNGLAGPQKGKALGTFSVGGNAGAAASPMFAGFCAYVAGIHGLLCYGVLNAIVALLLYRCTAGILHSQVLQHRSGRQTVAAEDAVNDWTSFGKLTVLIFARSVAFSACNTFIPLYFIHVLGTTAATGSLALSILFGLGAVTTYLGGLLADRLGYVRTLRLSFFLMIPAMFLLVNSHTLPWAMALLLPVAFALFVPYSATVVLGQTYLAKNIGFASGVTLGLTTTFGGLVTPLIGRAADQIGVAPALQILWIVAIIGTLASFLLHKQGSREQEPGIVRTVEVKNQ